MKIYCYFLLPFLFGCADPRVQMPPFEDIDAIVARHLGLSAVVVERPHPGTFREGGCIVGHVGQACSGSFDFKGKKRAFQYSTKVDGKYYVVTFLADKDGRISLLVMLYPGKVASNGNPPGGCNGVPPPPPVLVQHQ